MVSLSVENYMASSRTTPFHTSIETMPPQDNLRILRNTEKLDKITLGGQILNIIDFFKDLWLGEI